MGSKWKLAAGILLLALFLIGSAQAYRMLSGSTIVLRNESSGDSTGEDTEKLLAPDFTVTDREGNEVKLSSFRGTPVVLNFWASWCPPCKAEMPDFEKLWQEYGEDVAFLMVNATDGSRETKETADGFIREQGYGFPVYYDTSQEALYVFAVNSFPTTVLIDSDGYLTERYVGMLDEDTLREGIEKITFSEDL